jgi:hypothetical protein
MSCWSSAEKDVPRERIMTFYNGNVQKSGSAGRMTSNGTSASKKLTRDLRNGHLEVHNRSESWTGIGVVAGFGAVMLIWQWPHVRNGDTHREIKLLHILQEVRTICKTRNQLIRIHDLGLYPSVQNEFSTACFYFPGFFSEIYLDPTYSGYHYTHP